MAANRWPYQCRARGGTCIVVDKVGKPLSGKRAWQAATAGHKRVNRHEPSLFSPPTPMGKIDLLTQLGASGIEMLFGLKVGRFGKA